MHTLLMCSCMFSPKQKRDSADPSFKCLLHNTRNQKPWTLNPPAKLSSSPLPQAIVGVVDLDPLYVLAGNSVVSILATRTPALHSLKHSTTKPFNVCRDSAPSIRLTRARRNTSQSSRSSIGGYHSRRSARLETWIATRNPQLKPAQHEPKSFN